MAKTLDRLCPRLKRTWDRPWVAKAAGNWWIFQQIQQPVWTLPVKRILYRMLDIAMLYCWRGIFDPVVEVILTKQPCEWTLNMTKWYQICATFRLALQFRVILTSFCTICNMYMCIYIYICVYIIRSIKFTSFSASVHGAYSFIAHLHSDSSPVLVIGLLEFFLTTPL